MDAAALASAPVTPASPSPVTLTAGAVAKVKATLEENGMPGHWLRIAAVPGGCSGYQYALELVAAAEAGDVTSEQDGVRIAVDVRGAEVLAGTVIDFVDDGMRAGFSFKNPNAVHTCGCGHSFQA